jgi:hypothetical protein
MQLKTITKTYNSGDSLVVTHLTTNPLVYCLYMAERTGSLAVSHTMDSKVVNFSVYSKPHGEPCAEIYTLLITIDIRFMHMLYLDSVEITISSVRLEIARETRVCCRILRNH